MPDVFEHDRNRALRTMRGVTELTQAGKLVWQARDERSHSFEVDLPNGNLEIGSEDDDGVSPYNLTFFGPGPMYGKVFELNGRGDTDLDDELAELWDLAVRSATNVDPVLDGLLSDIEQLKNGPAS